MKINRKLRHSIAKLSIALLLFSHITPILADTIEGLATQTQDAETEVVIDEPEEVVIEEEIIPIESEIIEEVPTVPVPSEGVPVTPESESGSSSTENGTSTSTESTTESTTDFSTDNSTTEPSRESTQESSTSTSDVSTRPEESTTVSSSETSQESTIASSSESSQESTSSTSTQNTQETTSNSSQPEEQPSKKPMPDRPAVQQPEMTPEIQNPTTPLVVFPGISRPLDPILSAQSFVASDLNGFELPLLNTYQDQREAAIVAAALTYLNAPYEKGGKGPDSFDNLNFPRYIYQQIFSLDLSEDFTSVTQVGNKVTVEQTKPGDLLVWEKEQKIGIYLGQNKFMMADDTLLNEQEKEKKLTKEESTEIPGIRIFTLHPEGEGEKGNEDQDLLTRYDFIDSPDYGVGKKAEWRLSAYGSKELSLYPASFNFQENPATNAFIDSIGESARELGLQYDIFASVLVAQAILESGSGSSGLSIAPYYNLFGIKGSLGGSSVVLPTKEDNGHGELYEITSAFRVYPSYRESLEDYVHLIRSGISGNDHFYKGTWRSTAKNYLKATAELTGKYATDTFYYNKLNSLITTYNLTRFDEPRLEVGGAMMNLAEIPAAYRNKVRFPEYNGQNYNTSGSYGSDQCTWYVYNRVNQLGGKVGDFMGNGADWRDTGVREGYQTSDVPKAGYVISFKQGVAGYHPLYGHVAFVEAVGEDGILISEGDASYLSYRIIPNEIALSSGVGYVAPK